MICLWYGSFYMQIKYECNFVFLMWKCRVPVLFWVWGSRSFRQWLTTGFAVVLWHPLPRYKVHFIIWPPIHHYRSKISGDSSTGELQTYRRTANFTDLHIEWLNWEIWSETDSWTRSFLNPTETKCWAEAVRRWSSYHKKEIGMP